MPRHRRRHLHRRLSPLRDALTAALGRADPVYAGIGVMLETRAPGTFVTGVLDGFPADAADIVVPFDPTCAAGADPQLDRAVAVAVDLVRDTSGGNRRR